MKTETAEIYSIDECIDNPKKLYVFGENERQQGTKVMGGGQAQIRGCDNSFGFCTLSDIGMFWRDDEFKMNVMRIELDISELRLRSQKFESIVFPRYGLGTGRANMQRSCPKTFLYLCGRLLEEFGYNNIAFLKPPNF